MAAPALALVQSMVAEPCMPLCRKREGVALKGASKASPPRSRGPPPRPPAAKPRPSSTSSCCSGGAKSAEIDEQALAAAAALVLGQRGGGGGAFDPSASARYAAKRQQQQWPVLPRAEGIWWRTASGGDGERSQPWIWDKYLGGYLSMTWPKPESTVDKTAMQNRSLASGG